MPQSEPIECVDWCLCHYLDGYPENPTPGHLVEVFLRNRDRPSPFLMGRLDTWRLGRIARKLNLTLRNTIKQEA